MAIFKRVTFSKAHHFGYPCQFSGVYIPPYFHYFPFSMIFKNLRKIWLGHVPNKHQKPHLLRDFQGRGPVDVEGSAICPIEIVPLQGTFVSFPVVHFVLRALSPGKSWRWQNSGKSPFSNINTSSLRPCVPLPCFFLFEEDSAGVHLLSVFCRLIFPSNPHAHIASRHLAVC